MPDYSTVRNQALKDCKIYLSLVEKDIEHWDITDGKFEYVVNILKISLHKLMLITTIQDLIRRFGLTKEEIRGERP